MPANLGRLDGQVRATWDPASRAHERFFRLGRLGVPEGPGVRGRDPHNPGEVGQRHQAVEGTCLSGEPRRRVVTVVVCVVTDVVS